jgi:hypothetical protein
VTYPENSSVVVFNHIVPRIGASYDIMGDGQTVLKGNWGRFYFNPGVNLADAVNSNTSDQYSDHVWNDLNGDRLFQDNERGALCCNGRVGGLAAGGVDPDIKNPYTDEASVFVERALMTDLGIRTGFVWKKDSDGWQRLNLQRPFSAYNVPVSIVDPGPDGNAATLADNGPNLSLFNIDDPARGTTNVAQTVPDYEGTYKTIELAATKRHSNRWSMQASFSYVWTEEYGNLYFNNRFGTAVPGGAFSHFGSFPVNPNEPTQNEFTNWNAKFSGTIEAAWGLRVTPVWKVQSGAPYGRFITVTGLNYTPSQLILVEPIGTRRQDTVSIVDFRVEKQVRFAQKARVGLFFDVFNTFNSNTAVNLSWGSGASFEKATTVLGPRIAKFGAKFDW